MADNVVIRGQRLVLRRLRPAEIEAEWQAMVTADPIATPELPDEAEFRARLARSGQLHDGWLDLAVDAGGESVGRIQTFVRVGHSRRERSTWGLAYGTTCAARATVARRSPC